MEQPVVTVSSDHTISEALNEMIKAEVWSLLVERQGLPVGVLTDRDILIRCVAKGRAPDLMKVEEIMSSPLITIDADKRAGEALHMMVDKRVRRLYIVDQGKVIGRVTQTGLSRSLLDVMITLDSVTQQL
jgi:CBS domain-containing protein